MTATNHVVTGIAIVALVPNPAIGLPLAFLAHFALDALPHFGDRKHRSKSLDRLKYVLPIDMALAAVPLVLLAILQPEHWFLLVVGGVLCASPDLMWIPKYVRHLRGLPEAPKNWLMRFHSWIQWGERPWGIWVELAWFIAVGWLVLYLV